MIEFEFTIPVPKTERVFVIRYSRFSGWEVNSSYA
jgi:hypothetical protein